jgi:hypothetical protein
MLSTETAVDPDLNALTLPAYALYLATIPHLDRDGLIDAHPVKLTATVAPLRYELHEDAARLINEWIEIGLVIRYEVTSRQAVLFFKGFRRHQQGMEYGREPASRFPPPPGWTRTKEGLVPVDPELCLRLADSFHAKSAYRRLLIEAAGADVPADDVAQTSRTLREPSRTLREQFAPNTNIREENNGGGGVQTYTLHHPGFGNGGGCKGGTATAITAALADLVDDDLRIAADQIGSLHGLHDEFNGWPRFLSGATRQELLLVLAWCARWSDSTPDELSAIKNMAALLRSKVKIADWPGLSRMQIANLQNMIEDALYYAVPEVTR